MDQADAVARALADLRASLRRTGKVTGTVGSKVIVELQGVGRPLPKLKSYVPTVGDVVIIDCTDEGSWLVLGTIG